MDANPESNDGDGDLVSNENENMPELEPSVEKDEDVNEEQEEGENGGGDVLDDEQESNDNDDSTTTPVLVQHVEDDDESATADLNDDEENEEEGDGGIIEEEEGGEEVAGEEDDLEELEGQSSGEMVDAVEHVESEEETAEGEEEIENAEDVLEEEEDEQDYESGNPSEAAQNNSSSNEEDEEDIEEHEQEDNNNKGDTKKSVDSELGMNTNDNKTSAKTSASLPNLEKTTSTRKRSASLSSSEDGPKRKQGRSISSEGKEQGTTSEGLERTHDKYCWVCHKDGVYFNCKICPRSYHMRCICLPDYPEPTLPESDGTSKTCICPECVVVMNAENVDKRSEAMKMLSMDQLVSMLKYICGRMKLTPGVEPFLTPVLTSEACDYYDYIIYPMDIQTLEKNIKQRQYGSTEAFLADAQWLVHNSIIFNSSSSPITLAAKRILKVCKQELSEIETCPECYTNAHTKSETWFVEACKRPHILVWAKLKGFPYWPAKAMKIKDDQVDVRFFGQHDRAWVNLKDCFLYSEEMPASPPKKNDALRAAIKELNTHISKLSEAYGKVVLASVKTPLGRELSLSEIQRLLPDFNPSPASQQRTSTQVSGKNCGKGIVKSPMTITISSLKTNPTIVNNSLSETSQTPPNSKATSLKSKRNTNTSLTENENSSFTPNKGGNDKISVNATNSQQSETTVTDSSLPDDGEGNDNGNDTPSSNPPPPSTKEDEPPVKGESAPLINDTLDDDFESRVPSGEILASALGLKRITRRASQTETNPPSMINQRHEVDKTKPVFSHLQAQLRKTSSVSVTAVSNPELEQSGGVSVKTEPMEEAVEDDESENSLYIDEGEEKMQVEAGGNAVVGGGALRNKTQDFMEHISTQAQTKPGYRFNISKDISISAIGQDNNSTEVQEEAKNLSALNNTAISNSNRLRKSFGLGPGVTVNTAGNIIQRHGKQQLQQVIHQTSPIPRQRFNQPITQQQQQPRFKDVLAFTRMLRPASSKIQNAVPNVAASGGRQSRAVPGAIQMSSLRDNSPNHYGHTNQQLQKVGSAIQVNQVQSVQGQGLGITLPGGTITVTPLAALQQGGGGNPAYSSVNGERSLLKPSGGSSTNSNGLPMSMSSSLMDSTSGSSPAVTATPMKPGVKNSHSQLQQQQNSSRNKGIVNMVPPSVVSTVQGLQKSVSELIRVAAEQIAVDMVEHSTMKNESDKNYKIEHEKLIMKHIKEITDMRHTHEILMRELRSNMDNDKKRAVNDVRRQMEVEKQKAVEEAKKKQWCALCGREALFYCCWNTSYCGYPCQEDHWPSHMSSCSQSGSGNMNAR